MRLSPLQYRAQNTITAWDPQPKAPSKEEGFPDQVDPDDEEQPTGDAPQPPLPQELGQTRPYHQAEGHHEDVSKTRTQDDGDGGNGGSGEDDDGELCLIPQLRQEVEGEGLSEGAPLRCDLGLRPPTEVGPAQRR